MSCSCTSTAVFTYTVRYDTSTKKFSIWLGTSQLATCAGSFTTSLTGAPDCAELRFEYTPQAGWPSSLRDPAVSGNCPCEVGSSTVGGTTTYMLKFKPPAAGSCTYNWLLKSVPSCTIGVVVTSD